jgi:CheY-like chemotaxis protein
MHIAILDDDRDTALGVAVEALRHLGHTVDAFSDPADYYRSVLAGGFDMQVVDCKLPNAQESVGLHDGPAVVAFTAASGGNLPTVFLTNFGRDAEDRMKEFDPRLVYTVHEKPTEHDLATWSHAIDHAIEAVTSKAPEYMPESLGVSAMGLANEFFQLKTADLERLSEDERDDLEGQATIELADQLNPIWAACDSDWLKLQRFGEAVLVVDRGMDAGLPSLDDLEASERSYDAGGLIVGRPLIIEEFSSGATGPRHLIDCSPEGGGKDWARYPFVRLTVGEVEREFHLDTGNPLSLVARDLLLQAGVALPRRGYKNVTVQDLAGQGDTQKHLPVVTPVSIDGPDGNVELHIELQAVKRWERTVNVLNRPCDKQRCPGSRDRQCARRLGLMGRDLLYELDSGAWLLLPQNGQFVPAPGYRNES